MNETWNFVKYLIDNCDAPEREVYCFNNQWLDFRTLRDQSARVASMLLAQGVGASDRVLMFLHDTPATVFCFLGALQMGAIPVLLNPHSKQRYIKHYIADSQCSLVISEISLIESFVFLRANSALEFRIWQQDVYPDSVHPQKADNGIRAAQEYDPLQHFAPAPYSSDFWQYTSGTTGLPKAVRQHTRGMVENARHYAGSVLNIQPDDTIFSSARMFFGYGLGNSLFFPLLRGARAILEGRWPTPATMLDIITRHQPSVLFSVPSLYLALIDDGERIARAMGPGARYVSAGSPLPGAIFNAWRYRYDVEILDGIGATEAAHIFISNRPGSAYAGATGTLVEGYQAKLVTSGNTLARPGESGVLHIKGPTIAAGYFQQPDKTRERFQEGWYCTGDVFKADEARRYFYVGRQDDIFKIKGRWVAPQAIENFVQTHFPSLTEVALVPGEDDAGEAITLLYYATRSGAPLDTTILAAVSQYLAESFGSYVVPARYLLVAQLPRNDNGKLLRRELSGNSVESAY